MRKAFSFSEKIEKTHGFLTKIRADKPGKLTYKTAVFAAGKNADLRVVVGTRLRILQNPGVFRDKMRLGRLGGRRVIHEL